MASESTGFQLEQRVQSENPEKGPQVGTVKYIGAVQGYQGVWIGVDWDNGHGRHDGTVNGVRYFESSEEKSGSLVRAHSLRSGITLVEALHRRYNPSTLLQDTPEDEEMYVMSVRQRRMAVELVGKNQIEARQRQLQNLQVASLEYAGVGGAGPAGQISALVPNIKELDLTGNLLPDWLTVGQICTELSSIEVLNLSCNRLRIVSDVTFQASLNIKTLVLNYCRITWTQVEQVKGCLRTLEELHLCGNKIQKIEATTWQDGLSSPEIFVKGFESLRLLNLEDNCIESWREVMKLSGLNRLEQLNLNSNSIQEVVYPGYDRVPSPSDDEEGAGGGGLSQVGQFCSLCSLLLGKNLIADWASIDALDKFPALKDLRLSENPLTSPTTGAAPRFVLIARIQKLAGLNGSEVKARERRDAEIRYVRSVMNSATGGSTEELEKLHPRLLELRCTHDVPVELGQRGGALTSQKMSATLYSINILCVSSSVGEKPPIIKKLPASTTVGKLKQICEGLFKLRAARQRLYIKDQDPLPVPLERDFETLDDLGLGAGAVILVDDA